MFKTQQEKVRVTQIGHFYHTECWYHLPFAVYEKTEIVSASNQHQES